MDHRLHIHRSGKSDPFGQRSSVLAAIVDFLASGLQQNLPTGMIDCRQTVHRRASKGFHARHAAFLRVEVKYLA